MQRIPNHNLNDLMLTNQPQQTAQILTAALAPQRQQRLRRVAKRIRESDAHAHFSHIQRHYPSGYHTVDKFLAFLSVSDLGLPDNSTSTDRVSSLFLPHWESGCEYLLRKALAMPGEIFQTQIALPV